jgi:hypothetical protein
MSAKSGSRTLSKAEFRRWTEEMSDQILTTGEIAVELRCSKAQVYRLLNGAVKDVPKLAYRAPLNKKERADECRRKKTNDSK